MPDFFSVASDTPARALEKRFTGASSVGTESVDGAGSSTSFGNLPSLSTCTPQRIPQLKSELHSLSTDLTNDGYQFIIAYTDLDVHVKAHRSRARVSAYRSRPIA